eukprot:7951929-Alexandrium_andersonii.AAC.1
MQASDVSKRCPRARRIRAPRRPLVGRGRVGHAWPSEALSGPAASQKPAAGAKHAGAQVQSCVQERHRGAEQHRHGHRLSPPRRSCPPTSSATFRTDR